MLFEETSLSGVVTVSLEERADSRGSFTRIYAFDDFAKAGLCTFYPEFSVAKNTRRGVLRGMHYQTEPHAETKVIRCVRGQVYDVLVDLRRDSPTYGKWADFHLDGERPRLLYVPAGCAHGYQSLTEYSELEYLISARYQPSASAGIHWASASLAIRWPIAEPTLSERDSALPPFEP